MQTLHQAPDHFGPPHARWRLRDLRRAVAWLGHYSLAGIWRALHRLGVRPQRGRLSLHSPDPHYQEKCFAIQQAAQVARRHPERVRVFYGDEVSVYRQPTLAACHAPPGRTPKARLSWHANTRYRVSGALDVVSGHVLTTSGQRMGVAGLCAFLRQIRAAYPTQLLVLVWDNWPVHRHPRCWPPQRRCIFTCAGCRRMRRGPLPLRNSGAG